MATPSPEQHPIEEDRARARVDEGYQPNGHVVTWVTLVLTVVGGLAIVMKTDSLLGVAIVFVVALLVSIAVWRMDILHQRGSLDLVLSIVSASVLLVLILSNALLAADNRELRDASRRPSDEGTGENPSQLDVPAASSTSAENLTSASTGDPGAPSGESSTSAPRPSTTTTTYEANLAVLNNGTVTLPRGGDGDTYFDLEEWNSQSSDNDAHVVDLVIERTTLSGLNGAVIGFNESDRYETCATVAWRSYINTSQLAEGRHLCVSTTADNIAILTVEGLYEGGAVVSFVGTTYDVEPPPGS